MLSSRSVAAPVLNLKPSRLLAGYTILGHALALSVFFYPMDISVQVRLIIIIAVMASFIYHWWSREPVKALRAPTRDRLWLLELKDGRVQEASLYGEYTVTRYLTVLRFQLNDGGKVTITLFPDSGNKEELRRMRVFLQQL